MIQPNSSNMLVCTVGAWPDYEANAFVFQKSADRRNIPVHVLSKGEPWQGFIRHKILAFRRDLLKIKKERKEIEFVLFADARDSVFTDDLGEIARRYRELRIPGKVLFSSCLPGRAFPYNPPWWIEEIESRYGIGGIVNSGGCVGHIDDMIRLLDEKAALHKRFLENPDSVPAAMRNDYESVRRDCFWSEQFFVNGLQYLGSPLIHTDITKHLFALWIHGFPDLTRRRVLVADPVRDVGLACVLHSPKRFTEEPEACVRWASQQGLIDAS